MKKYICTSEPKDTGETVGGFPLVIAKRGLFYSKKQGKHVYVREAFNCPEPQFELYKFKTKEEAQKLCNTANKDYNDNFKVEKI